MSARAHHGGSSEVRDQRRRTPRRGAVRTGADLDHDRLLRVLDTVATGPGLDALLPAVVDLLVEAAGADAGLVALREGDELVVRAATAALRPSASAVRFRVGSGLAGRAVREDVALSRSDDGPTDAAARSAGDRVEVVPGVPGPRHRSAAAIPLRGRAGEVLGVVALWADASGAFPDEALALARGVAALVEGPVENARLHDDEHDRVAVFGRLADVVRRLASVSRRGELAATACDGARDLLGAERCRLHLADPADGTSRVVARAATPSGAELPEGPPLDAPAEGALAVRVGAGDAGEGVLSVERRTPFRPDERGLLETVAAQLAVALRTVDLVERLTEEHLVQELFDAIAEDRGPQVVARVRSARIDPDAPHVVVVLEPLRPGAPWPGGGRLEARIRQWSPGALCDPGPERVRALVPLPHDEGGASEALRRLDLELDRLARDEGAVAGRSSVQDRLAAGADALVQAAAAARITRALEPSGGARAWEDLGAYRYLVGGGVEPDTRHARAVDALWRYDERRGSELVRTLERYLADRSVVPTARALSIHANTLRQRLERIEHLTGLRIAEEDLVSLELAIKLHRLRAPGRLDAA